LFGKTKEAIKSLTLDIHSLYEHSSDKEQRLRRIVNTLNALEKRVKELEEKLSDSTILITKKEEKEKPKKTISEWLSETE
jgi:cell division protein FtsB